MLKIQNLVKSYEDTTVVDDVTLDIPHGKVVSMIGPNGAGKSTVLGMISRLIARSSGLVEFKGKDVQQWESRELAKHLAILTQTNNVQMKLTVRELVAFGRFPHSGFCSYRRRRSRRRKKHPLHGARRLRRPLYR